MAVVAVAEAVDGINDSRSTVSQFGLSAAALPLCRSPARGAVEGR
jgi:hypothetical protein